MIELAFQKNEQGLLPAIVQDYSSGEVLMLAFINQLAWEKPWLLAKPITGAVPVSSFGSREKALAMCSWCGKF